MELQFYPYDFTYKTEKEKTFIYLYGKTKDHQKVCVIKEHSPFFYAKKTSKDERLKFQNLTVPTKDKPAKILKVQEVELELLGKLKPFWKLHTNFPKAIPILAKHLKDKDVSCYEKDILFTHRSLRDLNITPLTEVLAKGEFIKQEPIKTFLATSLKDTGKEMPDEWVTLAVDIETYAETKEINPEKNPILMIAVYGKKQNKEFQRILTWKDFPNKQKHLEVLKDEKEMLKRFQELVEEFDPEFLTGYYSDKFDFPYLQKRAEVNKIKLNLAVNKSQLQIRSGRGFQKTNSKVLGRVHIDTHTFIKQILGQNMKTESYSLNAVAGELLGSQKHNLDISNLADAWNNHPELLEEYAAYNLQDTKLAYELAKHIFPILVEFTKLIALPPFDLARMRYGRLVENYILKQAIQKDVIAPNKAVGEELERRQGERIQGAFVFEPTPNLYKDVVVFDFRSLYPTIISAHNIGPEGFQCNCCKDQERVPERNQYWFCQRIPSFLPSVLEHIILRRSDVKRLIKEQKKSKGSTNALDARSFALKILANSFYGYLGFYAARWYCLECAASTTAYARNYIKETIQKAEKKGFKVIYADTDSCFLILGDNHLDTALEFMNEINFNLPGHMELEFEGHFKKGIFVAIKGTTKGAKKKYALLKEDGALKITGFEFVRRNWSPLAKEVQEHVLNLVLNDKEQEALKYVREVAKKLKSGNIPIEKLILKTQITRPIEKYTNISPHVTVAKKLKELGEKVPPGTIIEYVIAKGEGLVRDRAKIPKNVKEYDLNYYLKNQLLPVVSEIFAVLGYSEEDLISNSSQKGLGNFF